MENKVTQFYEFDKEASWKPLFDIAEGYFSEGKFTHALGFISACLQYKIPNEEMFKVYKLAYKIFSDNGIRKQAEYYFDACMNLEKLDPAVIENYAQFYFVPDMLMRKAIDRPFFNKNIRTLVEGEDIKDAWFLFLVDGDLPDGYALEIAYLIGKDNMKDLVMLGNTESYIVSSRLLQKIGAEFDYLFIKDESEKVGQVIRAVNAPMKKDEQLQ